MTDPSADTPPVTPATEPRTAPWTESGRALEREIGGDYGEEIAAIEAEAAQGAAPLPCLLAKFPGDECRTFADGDFCDNCRAADSRLRG